MKVPVSTRKYSLLLGMISVLVLPDIVLIQVKAESPSNHPYCYDQRLNLKDNNSSQKEEDWGRPPNRTSGGNRGPNSEDNLIALVPNKSKTELTLVERPTFLFYIPELNRQQVRAKFLLLKEENKEPIFQESIILSGGPSIVNLHPNKPLNLDQEYRWLLSISIDKKSPYSVEGLIKRITADPMLMNQVRDATSKQEVAAIYASHGIWHDAVTRYAALRMNNPYDSSILADWHHLLDSFGLEEIAAKPLVNCPLLISREI